jgi:hypothetical protein
MHLLVEAAGSFVVTTDIGFFVWLALLLCWMVGGVVTAATGRMGFLFVGLLLGGLTWPLSALLIATPDSLWARAFYDAEKMSRARREFPRRLPYAQP